MKRSYQITFAFALLALGGALFAHSFAARYAAMGIGSPVNPVFFPRILLAFWLVLAVIILIEAFRLPKEAQSSPHKWHAPMAMIAVVGLSIWAMKWIGYIGVAGPVAFSCGWLLGYRRISILLVIAVIAAAATWWLFDRALGIPLPRWRL